MRLARTHLVYIAAQGVNFTVVRQISERLGKLPSRKSVGAVALVDCSQGALKRQI